MSKEQVPAMDHALNLCALSEPDKVGQHLKAGVLPLVRTGVRLLAVAPDVHSKDLAGSSATSGRDTSIITASRVQMARLVEAQARDALAEDAGHGLFKRDRLNSALHGILPVQYGVVLLIAACLIIASLVAPLATLLSVTSLLIVVLTALVIFRFVCMAAGLSRDALRIDRSAIDALNDDELPSYTVVVPMLREGEATLRGLMSSLARIDYPTDRLQILLVLEDTDRETRTIIESMVLPSWFDVLTIPDTAPHTKGKACNYALYFATGEHFTIYDAEDHPDPMQLKKAVTAFRTSPPDVACVQSHLNFYNVKENWLTRLFTLDYTVWYDFMLPGFQRLGVPICLGGTSNHFKTDVVRELDGWDAYNVTEDADLGLRIAKKGLRTIMLDSTTFEEANTRIDNWIRQRSRWMKGYMLTYMVHMRRPLSLYRATSFWGFAGIQLFVAGNFVGNLINPPLWGISMLWASNELWYWTDAALFPDSFWYPAMFCFIVGNSAAIGFTLLAAYRRRLYHLIPYALTLPAYWVLAAIATYKALVQVFTRPFYWEKTEHGLTTHNVTISPRCGESTPVPEDSH
jgi:cellulose synthase/poly-beta-1,6-N-acetylglucosamine synthase-like glycosyltransferase